MSYIVQTDFEGEKGAGRDHKIFRTLVDARALYESIVNSIIQKQSMFHRASGQYIDAVSCRLYEAETVSDTVIAEPLEEFPRVGPLDDPELKKL